MKTAVVTAVVNFLGGYIGKLLSKKNLVESPTTGVAAGIGVVTLDQYFQLLPESWRMPAYAIAAVLFFLLTEWNERKQD